MVRDRLSVTNRNSHTGFRLILTSMTLNDIEWSNSHYFAFFTEFDCFANQITSRWLNIDIQCESKCTPKTFVIFLTQVKYISVKFCQYVASLYLHVFTNLSRFILIFNKMVLIFLGVSIVFNVFSFKIHQVKLS